jgi:hypothetical protein
MTQNWQALVLVTRKGRRLTVEETKAADWTSSSGSGHPGGSGPGSVTRSSSSATSTAAQKITSTARPSRSSRSISAPFHRARRIRTNPRGSG